MKKPMIGILPLFDDEKESYWMLPGYMKGIEDAGGIPIMLPLTTDLEVLERLVETCDGFLFTGGHDVNPKIYGEATEDFCGKICNDRDRMEEILFKRVINLDKPAFGICRGLQLFNALLGGTLYQDLPTQLQAHKQITHQQKPPYHQPVHRVYIENGNPLHHIIHTDSLMVNSYHHQGIKELADQLTSVAIAEDGLVEAVYMPNKKFVLAVQWHPEFNYQFDDYNFRLFTAFVQSSRHKMKA
jgi:putative glutamine amidotransferase